MSKYYESFFFEGGGAIFLLVTTKMYRRWWFYMRYHVDLSLDTYICLNANADISIRGSIFNVITCPSFNLPNVVKFANYLPNLFQNFSLFIIFFAKSCQLSHWSQSAHFASESDTPAPYFDPLLAISGIPAKVKQSVFLTHAQ